MFSRTLEKASNGNQQKYLIILNRNIKSVKSRQKKKQNQNFKKSLN